MAAQRFAELVISGRDVRLTGPANLPNIFRSEHLGHDRRRHDLCTDIDTMRFPLMIHSAMRGRSLSLLPARRPEQTSVWEMVELASAFVAARSSLCKTTDTS